MKRRKKLIQRHPTSEDAALRHARHSSGWHSMAGMRSLLLVLQKHVMYVKMHSDVQCCLQESTFCGYPK